MEYVALAALSASVFYLIGLYHGYKAGKRKGQSLLNVIETRMEDLRATSRRKAEAEQKTMAFMNGAVNHGMQLERELACESEVFMTIQHAISDWCINHEEKDPFAL